MPKRTNPFQKLCHNIMIAFYEPDYHVEESVLEMNPRTSVIREIDIRITNRNDPSQRILIECRDHSRKQDVQWIDQIDGKAKSLGFTKAIAISSKGFTSGAQKEGKDRNIDTLHLTTAEKFNWRKWKMAINEITVNIEKSELVGVDFEIDDNWDGINPDLSDQTKILLIDKRDNTRIPLNEWLDFYLNHPDVRNHLQNLGINGSVKDIVLPIPCDPEMGLEILGLEQFVPLVELRLHVDYIVQNNKVPLSHLHLEGQHVLVGKAPIAGVETNLTILEKDNQLSVLFDQKNPNK